MLVKTPCIPDAVSVKVLAFLRDRKTGSITLDVKNGQILAWKITEAGRLDREYVDSRNNAGVD